MAHKVSDLCNQVSFLGFTVQKKRGGGRDNPIEATIILVLKDVLRVVYWGRGGFIQNSRVIRRYSGILFICS